MIFAMKKILCALGVILSMSAAHAVPYGNYDMKVLFKPTNTAGGTRFLLDGPYFDRVFNDLTAHAKNYPPRFDSSEDKERATKDTRVLSESFELLIKNSPKTPDVLIRAAFIANLGYNLDIPGMASRADQYYRQVLELQPGQPRASQLYGVFLSSSGKFSQALPHLQRAKVGGLREATFSLGMTYLAMGDKPKAIEQFEDLKRANPRDYSIDSLIQGIKTGRIQPPPSR